ncbi:hypothetical protein ARMGADRAFT_1080176 [Armillaria gallica]|uniref:Uncharacterized protein n=1 Tax=Armillaria gallica TaxID=47427 RepID=A0A2H3DV32_ARMGA|nr:hypothetical protein ARMGADRAFT_1080176 [Armillaria gallica]
MVSLPLDSNNQVVPPWDSHFTFSIDVTATLEVYCDGGDDTMLQKLDGLQDKKHAGYWLEVTNASEEE